VLLVGVLEVFMFHCSVVHNVCCCGYQILASYVVDNCCVQCLSTCK